MTEFASNSDAEREEIAIVGMAGRFPGADDVGAFWRNICDGVESIRPFSEAELAEASVSKSLALDPDFVNAGSVMADADKFDAAFFGISKREAELTDPQHLVFLECAWEVLESAGCDPQNYAGSIGVFGGVGPNTYYQSNLATNAELVADTGTYPLMLASEKDYAVTRISYKLNLTGPAVSVNTACSTSAVALHFAVQSLLSGESDLALAGGCRIRVPLTSGYIYQEDGILSPDGRCRPFDAKARGTVPASGVAIVALKRLSDAMSDRDTVYAVIRGTAITNDGGRKVGFTAPGIDGQVRAIYEALTVAEIDAESIGMVEAHGTGTTLGDPIEVAALTQAFRQRMSANVGNGYCAIGSLKSNIGHLDAAAGVAGVIKAALSLYHKKLPPSINFETPNPQIDFDNSPFYVNTRLSDWPANGLPRRATVNSLGLGGTNAHIVLEEASPLTSTPRRSGNQLIVVSAGTPEALDAAANNLADYLTANPNVDVGDVAFTLQTGRRHFDFRQFAVGNSTEAIASSLRKGDAKRRGQAATEPPEVTFMFPGSGAQYVGMAADLYADDTLFASVLDQCADILLSELKLSVIEILYGPNAGSETNQEILDQVNIAMPVLVAIEIALARLWQSWNIVPSKLIGHSLGEYTAAHLAGVLSLEDTLRVVAHRAKLLAQVPSGSMLSVAIGEAEVSRLLGNNVSLAAVNSPSNCVLSGDSNVIRQLAEQLEAEGIDARPIPISAALHSYLVDPVVDEFKEYLRDITFHPPQIPIVSCLTGDWLSADNPPDALYWAAHMRDTVRFSDAISRILEDKNQVLLEVGPGQTLKSLVNQHPGRLKEHLVVTSLRHRNYDISDSLYHLDSVGTAWSAGVRPSWKLLNDSTRRKIPLPTYPFERRRYWIEPENSVVSRSEVSQPVSRDAEVIGLPMNETSNYTQPIADSNNGRGREDKIVAELKNVLHDLSGLDPQELDDTVPFPELGFDSLLLSQASSKFKRTFGIRITFRQLYDSAPTLRLLAAYIDSQLDEDADFGKVESENEQMPIDEVEHEVDVEKDTRLPDNVGQSANFDPSSATPSDAGAKTSTDAITQLLSRQLQLMERQLQLLNSTGAQGTYSKTISKIETRRDDLTGSQATNESGNAIAEKRSARKVRALDSNVLTSRQQNCLDDLIRRFNGKTKRSKQLAQEWRPIVADNWNIAGFDSAWKELMYQIVTERSFGSRIWDVDGNEYIDMVMSLGAILFGHSAEFVVKAINEQLALGYEVGTQCQLLGEVSQLTCEMTDNERLVFCHSGAHAVETAIRLARTATGRDKVAYFTNAIHGRSDIVLGRPINKDGEIATVPLAAGIPQRAVDDALVLTYGSSAALEAIKRYASELALVLVEPVRTRDPDLQPIEYLRELRRLADQFGFLLVFDEVVTGFRAHPAGVKGLYNLQPDLTTYGKAIGGGLPIGIVAGRSELIDAIDGGPWSYGDASVPEAEVTRSGGTMIKHPITLAASRAVLQHLRDRGPQLQEDLTRRMAGLVADINDYYGSRGFPVHLEHFSSFLQAKFLQNHRFESLFQFFLRDLGIHIKPPSASFLSTAHSEEDIERIGNAFKNAVDAMAEGGFLDSGTVRHSIPGADTVDCATSGGERPLPLLPNAARFLIERNSSDLHHWNIAILLEEVEPLDPNIIRKVIRYLLERRDSLRLRFREVSGHWEAVIVNPPDELPFSTHDLSKVPKTRQIAEIGRICRELQASLNLSEGPIFRMAQMDLGRQGRRLFVIAHHLAMDGLSWRPFWADFIDAYKAADEGEILEPAPPAVTFETWSHALKSYGQSDEAKAAFDAWLELPWQRVGKMPIDLSGKKANTNSSARDICLDFSESETRRFLLETRLVPQKIDLLFGALAHTLSEWTGSDVVLFDNLGHGRELEPFDPADLFDAIGFFASYTPMVLSVENDGAGQPTMGNLVDQIGTIMNRGLSFDLLRYFSKDERIRKALGALPRADILFNYQGRRSGMDAEPAETSLIRLAPEPSGEIHSANGIRYYTLAIAAEIWKNRLRIRFVYSVNRHKKETIEKLAARYRINLLTLIDAAVPERIVAVNK